MAQGIHCTLRLSQHISMLLVVFIIINCIEELAWALIARFYFSSCTHYLIDKIKFARWHGVKGLGTELVR